MTQHAEYVAGDATDCGHRNIVWWADSRLWNEVMYGDPDVEATGVVCPICFARMAEEFFADTKTWRITGWKLVPEFERHSDGSACGPVGSIAPADPHKTRFDNNQP